MLSRFKDGDLNDNRQRLLEKTNRPGPDNKHYLWLLRCERVSSATGEICGHEYGANGSTFWRRKCPICQDDKMGLPLPIPRGR